MSNGNKNKSEKELRGKMEGKGFTFEGEFDETNSSTNYKSKLESMYASHKAMPYATDDDDKKTCHCSN